MRIPENKTVADLVIENSNTAPVFKKHGINFCCGGALKVKRAAEEAKTAYDKLEEDLLSVENNCSAKTGYNHWDLDRLTHHITEVHHAYIRKNVPLLTKESARVVRKYGNDHPELIQIQRLFAELAIELSRHTRKEELVVFPFIRDLVQAEKKERRLAIPEFGSLANPVRMMEEDHREVGSTFRRIAVLSKAYTPPADACNTFRAYYAKLDEFEQDLNQHMHLENNILFPRALALEKTLF